MTPVSIRGGRPDRYGEGNALRGYGTKGEDWGNREAVHLARFARAIGLDEFDDHPDASPASSLQPPASPLWLCPSCGWSPGDDPGVPRDPPPAACPKCGCATFEPVAPPSEPSTARLPPDGPRHVKRLTGAQRQQVGHLARTTAMTDTEIAALLGCSETTARRHRARAGLGTARRRRGGRATRKPPSPSARKA